MPRQRTEAQERAAQRRRVAEEVSAELGRRVGQREATRHRQAEKQRPAPWADTRFVVKDRVVDVDPADCRRVGQLVGRVLDLKVARGSYGTMTLQVAPEFWHTVLDAVQLSGHTLLITIDDLDPTTEDQSDA
jgi:hypothetical protein